MLEKNKFAKILLKWWDKNRMTLPWRENSDPYNIWVSEIMLQQTQIATVIPYYTRWMIRFPSIKAVAVASLDDVLKMWEGLGYYSRVRNLHAAAKIVTNEFEGHIPQTVVELMALPGIGRYTAGAIASIAFDQSVPALDGNLIRVLSRLIDLPDDVTKGQTKTMLWQLAATLVPDHRAGDFNQAFMEIGQQVCFPRSPNCEACPLIKICLANSRNTVSERPVRAPRRQIPHYDVVAGVIWRRGEPSATTDFLIARRPLDGLLGGLWEFPGGKQEQGETLAQALHREIQEELALDITVGSQLVIVKHAYTHFRITLYAYHARSKGGDPQHIGVADHAWVSIEDLEKYAFAAADRQIIAALKTDLLA